MLFSSYCPCRQGCGWPRLLSSCLRLLFPLLTFLSNASLTPSIFLLLFPILLPLFPDLFQCKPPIAFSLFFFPPLSVHHFRRFLISFLIKLSLIEPPLSVRSFFSYPIASLPRFLLSSFIFKRVLSSAVYMLVSS